MYTLKRRNAENKWPKYPYQEATISKKKKIIQIRAEISEIETRYSI